MDINGQHLLLDLLLGNEIDEGQIEQLLCLVRAQFTVVWEHRQKFEPIGETIVFILSESHFTIHTYPEHQFLSLDLYICSRRADLGSFLDDVNKLFSPCESTSSILRRGIPGPATLSHHGNYLSTENV